MSRKITAEDRMRIKCGAVGFAPVWPFKVSWNGHEWVEQMGPFTFLVWKYIVCPLWDGSVIINAEDVE